MRVLMISMSDVWADARVIREARALADVGHNVAIIGRGRSGELASGVEVIGVEASPGFSPAREALWPGVVRRMGRWALLPEHRARVEDAFRRSAGAVARQREFDCVHAHDFPALPLAAVLQRERGVSLVYDSHECWFGRRLVGRPTPIVQRRHESMERELGTRADAVITVSDGISRWLRRHYGWKHVTVVRNTFPVESAGEEAAPGPVRGVVYAGRIGARRDLETVATASTKLVDLDIDLVGHLDPEFGRSFAPGRARVHGPIQIDDIDGWYRRAGLAAVPLADDCLNHRLALPNKVFHAVRAGVPVVAADLPELGRLVREHGLGTLYRPGDPASFEGAVRRAADAVEYHRRRVVEARDALSWDVDSRALLAVYDRLAVDR